MKLIKSLCAFGVLVVSASNLYAEPAFYNIGSVSVTDYYVDPVKGDDSNSGLTAALARKTVTSIWNSIPTTILTKGYRINLAPGRYTADKLPTIWENRHGTSTAPIIIQPFIPGGVTLETGISLAGVSYFYLIGVSVVNPTSTGFGRAINCKSSDHILIRSSNITGAPAGLGNLATVADETVSFNQSNEIYFENNIVDGAKDNALEFVAVQRGHIKANQIRSAAGWCASLRGGTSYISVDANKISDCRGGGVTSGEKSGLDSMIPPWIRFETNYIKITNNIITNTDGAAVGVSGGFNTLIANNTAYKVGKTHHLVEFSTGTRTCGASIAVCSANQKLGGWGPTVTDAAFAQPIGNQNAIFANNVVYNPVDYVSGQHLLVSGPRVANAFGMPINQLADDGLKIFSNVIWNGNVNTPLGIEAATEGCQGTNTTCNQTLLNAQNKINTLLPFFTDPATEDFRPLLGSQLAAQVGTAVPEFAPLDVAFNPIPEGDKSNLVSFDFSGTTRPTVVLGSFASPNSSKDFQYPGAQGGGGGGTPPAKDSPPAISKFVGSAKKSRGKVNLSVNVVVTDDVGVFDVRAEFLSGQKSIGRIALKLKDGKYQGTKSISTSAKSLNFKISAKDTVRNFASITKNVKVK